MASIFGKRKNRTAQAVVAGTTGVIAAIATGGLSLIVAGAAGIAWWVTGKATEK